MHIRFSGGAHIKTDDVTEIIKAVSTEVTLRYFGRLKKHQIGTKSGPQDFFTIADRKAEKELKRRLMRLLPGSAALGEETATGRENISGLSAQNPLWVIDPIDGTRNYKNNSPLFGCMVALVYRGETRGAWIHFPVSGKTIVAKKGSGAFLDGARLRVKKPNPKKPNKIRGVVDVEYFDDAGKRRRKPVFGFGEIRKSICSAFDYGCMATTVRIDEKHAPKKTQFFSRRWPRHMHPWDHLPGLLIAKEAGAYIRTWKGNKPNIDSINEGILVASDRKTWTRVRTMLSEVRVG